jgi:hypothetical protein
MLVSSILGKVHYNAVFGGGLKNGGIGDCWDFAERLWLVNNE